MRTLNLDITRWGPAGWRFLTAIALMFPSDATPEDFENYTKFFELLAYVLPCGLCRSHFAEYVKIHPVPRKDARALLEWLNDLHNEINRENNKPEVPFLQMLKSYLTPEQAVGLLRLSNDEAQEMKRLSFIKTKSYTWPIVILAILLVLLIVIAILIFLRVFCK